MDDWVLFLVSFAIGLVAWVIAGENWILPWVMDRLSERHSGPTSGAAA